MALQNYINKINSTLKIDPTNKTNVFDPRTNDGIINCYTIMEQYKKNKKEKETPVPEKINTKKHGEHTTMTFKFSNNVDASTLTEIITTLKLDDIIQVSEEEEGNIIIEIEK